MPDHRKHTLKDGKLKELAGMMKEDKGRFCIFLGSGASQSATIPTGEELKRRILRKIYDRKSADIEDLEKTFKDMYRDRLKDEHVTLEMVMQSLKDRFGKMSYRILSKEVNSGKIPPKGYFALANIIKNDFVKIIFTTNFDELLERAFDKF